MNPRIAVLMGGMSPEREVSLSSGTECAKTLRAEGYDVVEIDAAPNLWEQLSIADPDIVFNALHGEWGEDGRVQGILDMFGAPYTHSGVMASALAMDKHRTKAVLRDVGISVPKGTLVSRIEAATTHAMDLPYVVKPNTQGSSVGVYIVKDKNPPPLDPIWEIWFWPKNLFRDGNLQSQLWAIRRSRSQRSSRKQAGMIMTLNMLKAGRAM